MKQGIILSGLLAALLCGGVHAADEPLELQSKPGADQFVQIRKDLSGDTYAEITPDDRRTVLSLLDRMEASMQKDGGIEAMSEQQKNDLFNNQEQVNVILTQAARDSRMICRREQVTGSHRKKTICLTAAERNRIREKTQDQLRTMPRQSEDRGGF